MYLDIMIKLFKLLKKFLASVIKLCVSICQTVNNKSLKTLVFRLQDICYTTESLSSLTIHNSILCCRVEKMIDSSFVQH